MIDQAVIVRRIDLYSPLPAAILPHSHQGPTFVAFRTVKRRKNAQKMPLGCNAQMQRSLKHLRTRFTPRSLAAINPDFFWAFSPEQFPSRRLPRRPIYSKTNGNRMQLRARLAALVISRWCLAQLPDMRRGRSLPLSERYLRRRTVSL